MRSAATTRAGRRLRRGGLVGALLLTSGLAADAQTPVPLPFSVGEEATYQVRLGGLSMGRGSLAVTGLADVHGASTFHTVMTITGGNALVRVNNRLESWIDTRGIFSRRYHENKHEVRYRRNRTYDFFPESRTFRRENGDTGSIPTSQPLDDLSFLYYARTLPLEIGARYTVPRYFKADGNPVVLEVLRRETVDVPAGRFRTIVVRPIIQTDGLFGEGGRAEVYFSDDQYRIPVLIRSRVPVVGSLTMHLRTFRPGR
jgi:hypothetical protein